MEYLLTRLDEKILSFKKASKKALVAYLVAGDPDLDSTLELMHGFVSAGVDILEIGVPFTAVSYTHLTLPTKRIV